MKPVTKKRLKVLATATLSLGILASSVLPASAHTSQFRGDYYKVNEKVAMKTAKEAQKETKNFTAKKRVDYYNKVIDKIVKDSKKAENKELQVLSIYTGIQSKLSQREGLISKKEYKKYSHKDPGVYAINSGYSESKGYAYALRDALRKAKFEVDVLSAPEYEGYPKILYWVVIKLNNKYYHLDAYMSDIDDAPENNNYFLASGKKLLIHYYYKLKKPYTNTDNRYDGFRYLDTTRILKETKTHFYNVYEKSYIAKVSKTGRGEIIYTTPDDYSLVAQKNGWLYGIQGEVTDTKKVFYKMHINDFIAKKPTEKAMIKIMDLNPESYDMYELTSDDWIMLKDKNGKKVKYVLGK